MEWTSKKNQKKEEKNKNKQKRNNKNPTLYKCIMANTSAIPRQQAAHTTYQLLFPSCSTIIQKGPAVNKKYLIIFLGLGRENGPLAEKREDRKSKRLRKKNKRGDMKGKSNDGPEIPDRE